MCDSVLLYPNKWVTPPNNPNIFNYTTDLNAYNPGNSSNIFPQTNPLTPSHGTCTNHGNTRYWISLTVDNSGWLEFYFISGPQNSPDNFISWTLYKNQNYFNNTACDQLLTNTTQCIACNGNLFITTFNGNTGMSQIAGTLPNTLPVRREPSIYANAGDKFILLINVSTEMNLSTQQPVYHPRAYFGNAIPGNENSTTTATFTCEPWTVPQNICLGDSAWVELSNTYNGYDDSYTYTFLNNVNDVVNTNYAPWFQVLPTDTTTYMVEVSQNGVIYDTLSFTVNIATPPTPNAGPDIFLCEGDTAQFNAQLSDTSNYFLWHPLDTSDYISATDTLNIAYASQPDNDLLILFENNGVCPTGIDSVYIYTHPTPQLQVLQDTSICINGNAQLEAVVNNTVVQNYAWSFPSDSTALQTFLTDSNTWVSCMATDSIGCSSNVDSVLITVLDSINVNTLLNVDYCEGETITLNNTTTGGLAPYTYSWQYGGQEISTAASTPFAPIGIDELTLIVNDACETPADTSILSFTPYPMPSLSLNTNDTLLCYPGEINLSFTPSPLVQNWVWDLGDGNLIDDVNPLDYTYHQTGIFEVELSYTTTDNCKDTLASLQLEIIENPVAAFEFNNDITEFSTQVLFSNTSRYATHYSWSFENAQPATSTLENPTANFEEGEIGLYEIELIAFNAIGCSDTLRKSINIAPEFSLFAPNTFTPNGDQSNNRWSVAVNGIDTEDFHVQIFNRHGTLIFESYDYNFSWDGTYKGQRVPTGIYTWKIDLSTSQNAQRVVKHGFVNVQY
ncbi:T9SS type B sorting domain-containing protein [Lishizhenia tianjinensis]|uniref:T9SS type B sorting domain-containing protein n=1 Tax=Lishizhenia tianjinensis TaxID=477690 RepID=UPI00147F5BE5|nr:gliding motility-associated C-terminal domain-containing protein [Lishizhenia tianjinensis]